MNIHKKVIINIYQGKHDLPYNSNVNIIIDVIRAFTVSHYAFMKNLKEILLTNNEKEALYLKKQNKNFILAGEVDGYKIKTFDFGNSPYDLSVASLKNKTLVQKTTNGVSVTLNSLNSDDVIVTGYSNSKVTALFVKNLIKKSKGSEFSINIIASHPSGDDDLACAEFIKELILNNVPDTKKLEEICVHRIVSSEAAQKFYDFKNKDFSILDMSLCTTLQNSDFVIKAEEKNNIVKLYKERISND